MDSRLKLKDLQNGDLLVWRNPPASHKSRINYLEIVRILTLSDYGHVSTVWKFMDIPMHVEAAMPTIHRTTIPNDAEIYVIPMGLDISHADMNGFFEDKLGLKYSLFDAFSGLVGWTPKEDDRWQCAELCNFFYRHFGRNYGNHFTPSSLAHEIMSVSFRPLLRLDNEA